MTILFLLLTLQDPQPPPQRPLIIVAPADVLELKAPAEEKEPAELAPEVDLTLPTVIYVAAVSGAWASASGVCVGRACSTITPVLPMVSEPKTAMPLGIAIQGAMLWATHAWVAPRWPRVAQGILYGLGLVHVIKAADHVSTSRRYSRAAQ